MQSQDPTNAPSDSSTIVQSMLATIAPSDAPASTPSNLSTTRAPTEAQTDAATQNSTGAPTKAPTNEPIESPSIRPPDEPTESSISNPTISPTKQETDASTEPSAGSPTGSLAKLTSPPSFPRPSSSLDLPCQTQSGFFGSLTDISSVVKFGYELETDPSLEGKMEDDVLPVLEDNFNAFLLAMLFPSECGGIDESTQDNLITGISAWPDDQNLEEVKCRQVEVVGNICRVVLGELTIFTDETRNLEIGDLILAALRGGMEDGSFVVAHTSIERVSFIELGDLNAGLEAGDLGAGKPSSIGKNNDGQMVGLVFAAAGVALLIIGALVYRRRKTLGKRATLGFIIIPELSNHPYGSMDSEVSEVPEALFTPALLTPTDSSIFFDNSVPGLLSPQSELGNSILEVPSHCDSTPNAKMPDIVGSGMPSPSSMLSSFDDDATVELPPAAEDSSVSDESSETFPVL
jgi:hypothetical protein